MQRVTITMTDEIAEKLDRFMQASGAQNRSEAIRDLVRRALTTRADVPQQSACLAVLSCALDQSSRGLAGRVPQSRLERHDQNLAALSIPLDHTTSLEVAVMRGRVGELTGAAESLFLERGVMHGSLALIPISEDSQRHAHGEDAHEHTHLKVQSAF